MMCHFMFYAKFVLCCQSVQSIFRVTAALLLFPRLWPWPDSELRGQSSSHKILSLSPLIKTCSRCIHSHQINARNTKLLSSCSRFQQHLPAPKYHPAWTQVAPQSSLCPECSEHLLNASLFPHSSLSTLSQIICWTFSTRTSPYMASSPKVMPFKCCFKSLLNLPLNINY